MMMPIKSRRVRKSSRALSKKSAASSTVRQAHHRVADKERKPASQPKLRPRALLKKRKHLGRRILKASLQTKKRNNKKFKDWIQYNRPVRATQNRPGLLYYRK